MMGKSLMIILGSCGFTALMWGLYRNGYLLWNKKHKLVIEKLKQGKGQREGLIDSEHEDTPEQHIPYEQVKQDYERYSLGRGKIGYLNNIRDIRYHAIIAVQKGNSYQGIMNISFYLQSFDVGEYFIINFNGEGVKYLMVNGLQLDANEVLFEKHQIKFRKTYLNQKNKNNIEIIFENNYSFLNEGITAFFPIDQNGKYSLKQQLIYTINGYLNAQYIFPCLNCLNECRVQLQVIHPDNFQVFSNSSKSLGRLCSVNQYCKYAFLFDLTGTTLTKTLKMDASTSSGKNSSHNFDTMSVFTSNSLTNRKKYNTHFYQSKLLSIHHFFLFSSSMVELQPTKSSIILQQGLLLRYFCKQANFLGVAKNINKIHNYLMDVFRRLSSENIKSYLNKIDVLLIDDDEAQGYFAPGIILLNVNTITNNIDIKCYYLIARAVMGLLMIEMGENVVELDCILKLNLAVFRKFSEFKNFLYLKNQEYANVKKIVIEELKRGNFEGFILKYFMKQLRYIMKQNLFQEITFELKSLMNSYFNDSPSQFWENFIAQYNFLSPLITESLLKLSLKSKPIQTEDLKDQLKICFGSSKYSLNLYTNLEICQDLAKFMQSQANGLEIRLPNVKVKEKYRSYITDRYIKYLPIKANTEEVEILYSKFKKFKEIKNFHHQSLLRKQIARVVAFGRDFINQQHINLECGLMGWKLLTMLKIYPTREDYREIVNLLNN